jgi:signal peptidase II
MSDKLRVLLVTLVCTLPADQLSKAWVAARIPLTGAAANVPVIDGFFYLSHVRNAGVAFGLIRDWPWEWRLLVFSLILAMGCVVVIVFYRALAPGDRFNAFALGLILGGAFGNLIDRVFRGEVIDFMHFEFWGGFAWPDFNLADAFIVVGVCTLMLELLVSEGARRDGTVKQSGESGESIDV